MTATIMVKKEKMYKGHKGHPMGCEKYEYEAYTLKNVFNVQTIEDKVMVTYLSDDKNANRVQNAVYDVNNVKITITV